MKMQTGTITGINGNMLTVVFEGTITQNEVCYATRGKERLKSEVIRIQGNKAFLQVFESTKGLKVGNQVEFTGELLSVQLGPGLLTQIYDGLQNPLPELAAAHGFFLPKGVILDALSTDKKWKFTPIVKKGDSVQKGHYLGWVPETQFRHFIMVPFYLQGELTVESVQKAGNYRINETICTVKDEKARLIN